MAVLSARRRGSWAAASKVWKKVNGAWAEAEPSAAVEDGVRYQSYSKTVAVTGTGHSSYSYVVINGTKYTSAAAISVDKGTTIQCHVQGGIVGSGYIYLNGTQVSTSDYTFTVTENCTIELSFTNTSTYVRWGTIRITTP